MAREIAVTLYLFMFSILFKVSKWFPLKDKVVFVVSFSENNKSIYKEMMRQEVSCRTLFLTTEKMEKTFSALEKAETLLFDVKNPWDFIRSVYHLATAKIVFVDNYYGFLAKSNFRHGVECVQLWHANGAIKKFGFEDPLIADRGKRAKKRFADVYKRFSKVAIGSKAMGSIFSKAFHVTEDRFIKTGIPRTDLFFDEKRKERALKKVHAAYPQLAGKKVVLYAPTYRERGLTDVDMKLDLTMLANQLGGEYILLIRLHPAIRNQFEVPLELNDFVLDASLYRNMNELLLSTDVLITDYSSIPFEFALLKRPIIFFMYDMEAYERERGMWKEFRELIPGPVVTTSQEIVDVMRESVFDETLVSAFAERWNEYSNGQSSQNIVEQIKEKLQG
ncbi:CDP-glycerol glycerophosphotransferase family protein [Rossellomorea marisflavi]|uniref:CDP-glycerol glycerophosphotransferase family protein n=1 Tax=Rossellomorea marisflavi TaxID=189381 RepID=UPI003FA0074F